MNVLKLMKIINTKLPPYIWAWIAKYKNYEEQSGSGTLVFENTYGQKFSKFEVYGNTTQDGTPTPENLVPINNVTGDNEIKVENRNLLDLNKAIEYWKSISLQLDVSFADNKFTANILNQVLFSNPYKFSEEVKEFTISCGNIINNSSSNARLGVCVVDDEGNVTSRSVIYANTSSTKNCNALYFDWSTPGSFSVENIQIEKGSTATPYIPREEQTVTFPLEEGQYMAKGDYLANNGIHHVRGKKVLTGTESWIAPWTQDNGASVFCMENNLLSVKVHSDTSFVGCKCNKYIATNYDGGTGSIYYDRGNSNYPYLAAICYQNTSSLGKVFIKDTRFTATEPNSVSAFKASLAEQYANGTPVIIEYELAQETIEPYTQAQQEAWNKIKELHTYLDYTQISQTNDGLSFILKVSVN